MIIEGINFRLQKESYTSQVSPLAPEVCKEYAEKKNRISRGLYADGDMIWNADTVGAFNILRLYLKEKDTKRSVFPSEKALMKSLYLSTLQATKKWTQPLRNWGKVYGEFSVMYEDRFPW